MIQSIFKVKFKIFISVTLRTNKLNKLKIKEMTYYPVSKFSIFQADREEKMNVENLLYL